LIVTCPNCSASFEVEASQVPAAGTRVRCSQCETVFFLDPLSASVGASDVGEGEAKEGAEGERVLWGEAEDDDLRDSPGFGVELESADHDGDLVESVSSIEDEGELLEATPLEEDDFSDLSFSGEAVGAESTDSADRAEADDGSFADEEIQAPSRGGAGESSPSSSAAPAATASEQGPEDKVAIGAIALESVPAGSHRDVGVRAPVSWGLRRRFSAVGRGVGWGFTAVLILLALATTLRETSDSLRSVSQSIEVGTLRVDSLRGEWVDTMAGRTLLAVTGELRNPSSSPEILGAILEVSLVGSDGRRLVWPAAAMGLRIPENEIRELPPAALESSQEEAARQLAVLVLDPGQAVAVQTFFARPPDDAVRFALDLGPDVPRPAPNQGQ